VVARREALLIAAILAISTGAPFARWAAPAPPIAIAALRVGFAAVLLLAAGWRELGGLRALARKDRPLVLLSGVLLGIHFGSWIASLSFTSTAASVALVCTNPMFAAAFGTLLGDRVRGRELVGIVIAAGGCAVLAGGDWRAGGDALLGDGLALIGAASAAGYLVVGRRLRTSLPLLPYLGVVNAIAAIGLVIAAVALGADLTALPSHSYLACAGAAVVASFVGHSLLNAAVRTTPTHLVALAVLGEPIGSSLITWIAFGEQPPLYAVFGGAVILAGIAIGFIRTR
jgi:drug/metabolite transporter (DMT)-like permease